MRYILNMTFAICLLKSISTPLDLKSEENGNENKPK